MTVVLLGAHLEQEAKRLKKYYSFLRNVYQDLKDGKPHGLNMSKHVTKSNVNDLAPSYMQQLKYMKKDRDEGKIKYTWIGDEPTEDMASALIVKVLGHKNAAKKEASPLHVPHKIVPPTTNPMNKTYRELAHEKNINKIHDFLIAAYLELSNGEFKVIKLKDVLKEFSFNAWLLPTLQEIKVLEKISHGTFSEWRWLNIKKEPTKEMAKMVLDFHGKKTHAAQKESLKKAKEDKKRSYERSLNNRVISNIKEFLDDVYFILEGATEPVASENISLRERAAKYKVDGQYISIMAKIGILERSGVNTNKSFYLWTAGKPTAEMAEKIYNAKRNPDSIPDGLSNQVPIDTATVLNATPPVVSKLSSVVPPALITNSVLPSLADNDLLIALAEKWTRLGKHDLALETLNKIK